MSSYNRQYYLELRSKYLPNLVEAYNYEEYALCRDRLNDLYEYLYKEGRAVHKTPEEELIIKLLSSIIKDYDIHASKN